MARWILAATMAVGMGAFGATTASATDYDDVQSEWRDYQRELQRGNWEDAREEYREYCEAVQDFNRDRFERDNRRFRRGFRRGGVYSNQPYYGGGMYNQPYYGGQAYQSTFYGAPTYYTSGGNGVYGGATVYSSQPVYTQGYYHQRPFVARGGVTIWR